MDFADIKLKITEDARREIQTHVDALYRSEKYFQIKLERVDLYFPIIERIFEEEGLPSDFKYLVIQESALISDAVSSSNAVGFWQFKEVSGEEVGLRIDGTVDERLNIVSSTRGAARYLKRNNNFFGNWLYALLAYNTGAGGAQDIVDEKYFGAKKMEINKRTHWYIIKFLAHKVAFENATGKNKKADLALVAYTSGANKSLRQISNELNVDAQLLEEYNKWLKRGSVPDDKIYAVLVPTTPSGQAALIAQNSEKPASKKLIVGAGSTPAMNNRFSKSSSTYPIIDGDVQPSSDAVLATVNGKPGIIAGVNDNLLSLAEKGDVSISRFLKYNDLSSNEKAVAGQVYYLRSKRGRAAEHYHVVMETENMWSISQKYGIKLKKLYNKNRMDEGEQPKEGRVLWMRFVRPSDEPIEYKEVTPSQNSVPEVAKPSDNLPVAKVSVPEEPIESTSPKQEQESVLPEIPELPESDIQEDEREEVLEGDRQLQKSNASSFEPDSDIQFQETTSFEPTSGGEKGSHVVKSGETLYGIAKLYDVRLGDLLLWNDLSLTDGIQPNQLLKIKAPEIVLEPEETKPSSAKPAGFVIHEVTPGETMYKIARDYNVTIKEVMLWNDKEEFKVSIGEKLKIKKAN